MALWRHLHAERIYASAIRRKKGFPRNGKVYSGENYRDGESYVFALHLEWPRFGPQDSQGPRACSRHSTVGRSAGNASASVRKPPEGPDLCQRPRQSPISRPRGQPRYSPCAQSVRGLREGRVSSPEGRPSLQARCYIPKWHGWHAARRGLGSNLYRLGVPDMVIQRILRHANVSTTDTYHIKTVAVDVQMAMAELEKHIANQCLDSPQVRTRPGSPVILRLQRSSSRDERTEEFQDPCHVAAAPLELQG